MTTVFGGLGVQPSTRGQASNVFSLSAGMSQYIPAGTWNLVTGPYTIVQEYDAITGIWRATNSEVAGSYRYVNSDGANYRVVNLSGCVVGAQVTTAGSGYTSVPTVTDATSSATYQAIVGGAINTSVTVSNGGSGYLYPPQVQISAPGNPGVQATATCTISSGAVNAVTVVNQGAGYTSAPTINFINDTRDTVGHNASATCTLISGGTITAILVTNHGNAVTSLPTITISGGGGTGGAATPLMYWTTTAYTVTSAGSGYSGNVLVSGFGGTPAAALSSYTNPTIQTSLTRGRPAYYAAALAATAITATGQTLYDGGIFAGVPTGYVAGYNLGSALLSSAAQVSFTMGGASDTYIMLPV